MDGNAPSRPLSASTAVTHGRGAAVCTLMSNNSATLRALLNDIKGISDQLYRSIDTLIKHAAQISETPTAAVKPTTRKRTTGADERISKDQTSAQTANLLMEVEPDQGPNI